MYDELDSLLKLFAGILGSFTWILLIHPTIIGCDKKESPSQRQAQNVKGTIYISKSCNKKTGLNNDDPDLKSDKLMLAGAPTDTVDKKDEGAQGKANAAETLGSKDPIQ